MAPLIFATGNNLKFITALHTCQKHGIELAQRKADIPEIQSEDPEVVALNKAAGAYELFKSPVVITDDSWAMSGLRGFPSVYMHSINAWFTPEDFLRLTLPLEDRRVTLTQYLVYADGKQQKVFSRHIPGTLLKEIRGTSEFPNHTITSLEGDNGLSIAEVTANPNHDHSTRRSAEIWHDFLAWYVDTIK